MQSLSALVGRNPANSSGGVLAVGRSGLNYTCDSEISECTCKGVWDCINMGGSKDCDPAEPILCTDAECSCGWTGHQQVQHRRANASETARSRDSCESLKGFELPRVV